MDMRLRRIMGVVLSLVGFVVVILAAMPLMINTTNNSQIPAAVTEPAISAIKTRYVNGQRAGTENWLFTKPVR